MERDPSGITRYSGFRSICPGKDRRSTITKFVCRRSLAVPNRVKNTQDIGCHFRFRFLLGFFFGLYFGYFAIWFKMVRNMIRTLSVFVK